jgi:hypothetical protein
MQMSVALFAYLGPETVLPLTSVVAAVAGVVLMFGRNALRFVAHSVRMLIPGRGKTSGRPHFARKRGRDRSPSRSTGTDSTA